MPDRVVEFQSSAFPKYPNENEDLVNDNCWGKRLAEYVNEHLPEHGVPTNGILCEDWGWLVYLENADFSMFIGCGVMDEGDEDDQDGEASDDDPSKYAMPPSAQPRLPKGVNEFIMFVNAEPGFLKRLFRKVNTAPAVERAEQALKDMMAAAPGMFQSVKWRDTSPK
ncbi:hypothetical protein DES53_104462 [Roseimicrobium gellanilyticum]|uniref:Uncharacterized protein n=1 Tax=Roseimicrobium gellanilyticum TaxID=748857 RepID=A0A366HQ95_9BACT|nr:hypothetical protein [Roseimicrobium gellanilyticum]RBP44640.1 hypothetical protein DES53_104462 [Roseimicrobium gellanilyticum]